jgi:AcrR family transcriptional regulator
MAGTVKGSRPVRTRRADKAAATGRRIVTAATALFGELGYTATTIEAVAARADVAVETVYGRFRNKANLLAAVLEPAVVGGDSETDRDTELLELTPLRAVRNCTDQRAQVRLLAAFSRHTLQRVAPLQHILTQAAAADTRAADLRRRDLERRLRTQAAFIDMLLSNGPLRAGLSPSEAADSYSTLASPATYAFLIDERGWSPERFESWLADSLARLLLEDED